jgi:hypothetical protein
MPSGRSQANLISRVLLLAALVGLIVGGTSLLLIHIAVGNGITGGASRNVAAYLNDVKAAKYSQAYDRLCQDDPNLEPRDEFVNALTDARSRGHAVTSFQVGSAFTKETLRLSSAKGRVSFADGTNMPVTFDLQPFDAPSSDQCIVAYDDLAG